MATFIDIAIARVRERTSATATDSDALRRARQYDALGRRTEAITWYERALEALPESDPNREAVRKRLSELKGAQ
jgi:tetratricopeptide (TPR) repeat protein